LTCQVIAIVLLITTMGGARFMVDRDDIQRRNVIIENLQFMLNGKN